MLIWIVFIGIAIISYLVQANLKSKFEKYSQMPLTNGMTGKEVAEKMLRDNGIYDVTVTSTSGMLTDHYNPMNKTVNLSEGVYGSASVAAAAVAAHECGHAVQHARGYAPLRMRSALVPVVQFSSSIVSWVLLAGILMVNSFPQLLLIGTASQLKLLSTAVESQRIELEPINKPISLREFMLQNSNTEQDPFLSCAISIDRHSPILGKSMKAANLRETWHCLVIGLERGAYIITNPNVSLVFEKGDLLWVLGKQKMINTLVREEIL